MRMYAYLKNPIPANDKEMIYKIMMHEIRKQGVFVYMYLSPDAVMSSYDSYHPHLKDALEDWQDKIDERGWIKIDDPLPYCQHDCILPIRVKGREIGNPQWGKFEILKDGEWVDYTLNCSR